MHPIVVPVAIAAGLIIRRARGGRKDKSVTDSTDLSRVDSFKLAEMEAEALALADEKREGLEITTSTMVNDRGFNLFTCRWQRKGATEVRGVVFLMTGYADYIREVADGKLPGRWGGLAEAARDLARKNYACFGHDHQGQGRSEGVRCHISSFENLIVDALQFIDSVLEANPALSSLPRFLIGESMGGALCVQLARRRPDFFTGAVLLAPMVEIHPSMMPAWPVVQVLKVAAHLVPKAAVVPGDSVRLLEKCVHDPQMLEQALHDPMAYHGRARLKTSLELMNATHNIQKNFREFTTPLLILFGTEDTVTRRESAEALYNKCGSSDKTFLQIDGGWHALLDELDVVVKRVKSEIIGWIDQRATAGAAAAAAAAATP
eukprot:jgi/Mesvir1/21423/Mv20894-RA.1